MLTITFYGHACFALTDGETKLLIDPFFTGNGLAPRPDPGRDVWPARCHSAVFSMFRQSTAAVFPEALPADL